VPDFLLTPPAHDPLAGNQITVQYNFEWYKFIAYAVRQIIPSQVWGSPPADIGDQIDTLVYLLGAALPQKYADSILLLPPLRRITAGNGQIWVANSADWFAGHWHQNTPAIDDTFEWVFLARDGTHTFLRHGTTANNCGKVDWTIDGVSVLANDDWYSSAAAANVEHTANVTVVGDGQHTLQGKVHTKNASSSNYDFLISFARLYHT
jgi:hypothetical protein